MKEALDELQHPELARHKKHLPGSPLRKVARSEPASGDKWATTTQGEPSPLPGKLPASVMAALGQSSSSSGSAVPAANMHGGVLPLSALALSTLGAKPSGASSAIGDAAGHYFLTCLCL